MSLVFRTNLPFVDKEVGGALGEKRLLQGALKKKTKTKKPGRRAGSYEELVNDEFYVALKEKCMPQTAHQR